MRLINRFLSRIGIFRDLLIFVWQRKLWWLIPMIIVLVLFGLVLAFTNAAVVAPFIYTLF